MHLQHRMRAFQEIFHPNPDHALWYGWRKIIQDLTENKATAMEIGTDHAAER